MALVKYNNNSISAITTAGQLASGSMVLIKEQTASSSATISFVDGSSDVVLDSTYPIYKFEFINMHPATNDVIFSFQADTGTNTNYNLTVTSTFFQGRHAESDSLAELGYTTNRDQAQGTGDIKLNYDVGNGNDESVSGELYLFAPSSSVFVKHFMARTNNYGQADESADSFKAGYFNTTTAITRVRFKMTSGNIDAGTIKLYGIRDS